MLTETQQQTLDLDWFFIADDKIGFIASSGGKLPQSVALLDEKTEIVSSYFRSLPEMTTAIINDGLEQIKKSSINEIYLADFVFMAKRGLYAFDKSSINNFSDGTYHLVAKPTQHLKLEELPTEIMDLIGKTVYEGKMITVDSISIDDIK